MAECTICFEGFSETGNDKIPLILSCGHTFCKGCVGTYIYKSSDKPECPTCRRKQPNINNWTGEPPPLPINYALLEFVKVATVSPKKKVEPVIDDDILDIDDPNDDDNDTTEELPDDMPPEIIIESLIHELSHLRDYAEQQKEQCKFFQSSLAEGKKEYSKIMRRIRVISAKIASENKSIQNQQAAASQPASKEKNKKSSGRKKESPSPVGSKEPSRDISSRNSPLSHSDDALPAAIINSFSPGWNTQNSLLDAPLQQTPHIVSLSDLEYHSRTPQVPVPKPAAIAPPPPIVSQPPQPKQFFNMNELEALFQTSMSDSRPITPIVPLHAPVFSASHIPSMQGPNGAPPEVPYMYPTPLYSVPFPSDEKSAGFSPNQTNVVSDLYRASPQMSHVLLPERPVPSLPLDPPSEESLTSILGLSSITNSKVGSSLMAAPAKPTKPEIKSALMATPLPFLSNFCGSAPTIPEIRNGPTINDITSMPPGIHSTVNRVELNAPVSLPLSIQFAAGNVNAPSSNGSRVDKSSSFMSMDKSRQGSNSDLSLTAAAMAAHTRPQPEANLKVASTSTNAPPQSAVVASSTSSQGIKGGAWDAWLLNEGPQSESSSALFEGFDTSSKPAAISVELPRTNPTMPGPGVAVDPLDSVAQARQGLANITWMYTQSQPQAPVLCAPPAVGGTAGMTISPYKARSLNPTPDRNQSN